MKVSRTFDHTAIFCKHQLTNINLVTSKELPIFAGEVIRFFGSLSKIRHIVFGNGDMFKNQTFLSSLKISKCDNSKLGQITTPLTTMSQGFQSPKNLDLSNGQSFISGL